VRVKAVREAALREIHIQVPGQPPRKSNRRIIARRGDGTPFLPKSKEAQAYEKAFKLLTLKHRDLKLGSKDMPLVVEGYVYYKHKYVADLSIELILDSMTKAGIITDDRYVVRHNVWKRQDKENPRIDLRVREIEYDWGREE